MNFLTTLQKAIKLDICCVTETWLDDSNPKHTIVRSDLNVAGYNFIDVPRGDRPGGGTGIMFRNTLDVKLVNSGHKESFEFSVYKLQFQSTTTHIITVYRPPYSANHPVTKIVFFEEFSSFLQNSITTHRNVIICGDFNIHYNKVDNLDTIALNELCEVMGLTQLVDCQTHRSGNTLDLIMVQKNDKIVWSESTENFRISDHSFIHTYISLPKPKVTREIRKVRNLKHINTTNFLNDLTQFNADATKHHDPEDLAKFYNSELRNILDKHAPEKEKLVTIRPTLPWFTEESNNLKAQCRSAERKWRGNKTTDYDHAYKCAKRVYRKHLAYNKFKHINSKIVECGNDASKMYKLVFGLMGRNKNNPMPSNTDDKLLAEEFSTFFMDKILNIRKTLDDFEKFDPNLGLRCTHQFDNFHSVSEEDVLSVIKKSKPTTCPTDPIPSKLVKQFSEVLLPTITAMVNKSLTAGVFMNEWKSAIIRPLLKKNGLESSFLKLSSSEQPKLYFKTCRKMCTETVHEIFGNAQITTRLPKCLQKGL
jgi:exonuclease III